MANETGFPIKKASLGTLIGSASASVPAEASRDMVPLLTNPNATVTKNEVRDHAVDLASRVASDVVENAKFLDSFASSESALTDGLKTKVISGIDPELSAITSLTGETESIPELVKNSIAKIVGTINITGYSDLITRGSKDLIGDLTSQKAGGSILIGLGKENVGNVRVTDVLRGDFSGIKSIPATFVSVAEAKLSKAFGLMGYAINADPAGVFHIGKSGIVNLIALLADKNKILDDIDQIVDDIYSRLAVIGPDWYGFSRRQEIVDARNKLHDADVRLTTVKSAVINTGSFQEETFDAAKTDIHDAKDIVCNFKAIYERIFPGAQIVQAVEILALLEYLNTKILLLEKKQRFIDNAKKAMEEFIPNFQFAGGEPLGGTVAKRLNNVGAGMLEMLQEEIRSIIASMDADIEKNSEIRFIIDTKIWCIQLGIVLETTRFTGGVVDDYLSNDPDGYKTDFQFRADTSKLISFPDFTQLIHTLKAFKQAAEEKLVNDTSLPNIANLVSQIHSLTAAERANNDSLTNAFSGFAGPAVSMVAGALAVIEDLGLDRLAKIARNGDWNEFWKTTADTATSTGSFASTLTSAMALVRQGGGASKLKAQDAILRVIKNRQRSEQLSAAVNSGFDRSAIQLAFKPKLIEIQNILESAESLELTA